MAMIRSTIVCDDLLAVQFGCDSLAMTRSTTMRPVGSGRDDSLDDDASSGCDDSRRRCIFVVFEAGCDAHLNLWLMPRAQLRFVTVRKFLMGPSRAKGARDDRT